MQEEVAHAGGRLPPGLRRIASWVALVLGLAVIFGPGLVEHMRTAADPLSR